MHRPVRNSIRRLGCISLWRSSSRRQVTGSCSIVQKQGEHNKCSQQRLISVGLNSSIFPFTFLWEPLEASEILWKLLGPPGDFLQPLGASGSLWELLLWESLGANGTLAPSGTGPPVPSLKPKCEADFDICNWFYHTPNFFSTKGAPGRTRALRTRGDTFKGLGIKKTFLRSF